MEKYIYPNVIKALSLYEVDVAELGKIINGTTERALELVTGLDDWEATEAVRLVHALNSKALTIDTLFNREQE